MGRPARLGARGFRRDNDASDHLLIEQAKKVKGKAVTLDEYLARRKRRLRRAAG